jgi:glycosyltransferase involved in cell wall biosynthesis
MKLSVMMITYNHERFIAQALTSVLTQRVNFDYEIVVGDDCSTDGTRAIIVDFCRRYPDRIVPRLRNQNLGGPRNLIATLTSCRGDYVALLEGDDYWTCEEKLQKQVDFLDAHPDHALCCHRVQLLYETGAAQTGVYPSTVAGSYTIDNLLEGNFVATCATMFCRNLLRILPNWYYELAPGDWALFALIAKHGKIALMDEVMAMYRVHSGGTWSLRPEVCRLSKSVQMLKVLDKHLDFQYANTIRRTVKLYDLQIAAGHLAMAHVARTEGNRTETGKHIAGYLRNGGLKLPGSLRALASFTAYTIFGSWYETIRKARRASPS